MCLSKLTIIYSTQEWTVLQPKIDLLITERAQVFSNSAQFCKVTVQLCTVWGVFLDDSDCKDI